MILFTVILMDLLAMKNGELMKLPQESPDGNGLK